MSFVVTSHLQIISTDNSIVCRYDVIPTDNSCFESFSKWRGLQAFPMKSCLLFSYVIKQLLDEVDYDSDNYQGLGLCYNVDNTNLVLDNYRYHNQPHPIIVNNPQRNTPLL
jgi:hypothetical protein